MILNDLYKLLINKGYSQVFEGVLPASPDKVTSLFLTGGNDHRPWVDEPSFQIRVRSDIYNEGYQRAKQLKDLFINEIDYQIETREYKGFHIVGDIMNIGKDINHRDEFTINFRAYVVHKPEYETALILVEEVEKNRKFDIFNMAYAYMNKYNITDKGLRDRLYGIGNLEGSPEDDLMTIMETHLVLAEGSLDRFVYNAAKDYKDNNMIEDASVDARLLAVFQAIQAREDQEAIEEAQRLEELNTLTQNLENKNLEIEAKNSEINTLTQSVANLNIEVATITGEKNNLEIILDEKVGEILQLEAERDSLQQQLNSLGGGNQALQDQIDALTLELAQKTTEINNLGDQINGYISQIDTLNNQITIKDQEITNLNNSLVSQQSIIDGLNDEIVILQAEITSLQGQTSGARFPEGWNLQMAGTASEEILKNDPVVVEEVANWNDGFSPLADPIGGLIDGSGYVSIFSPDETKLLTGHSGSFLTIYNKDGDVFTKTTSPSITPSGNVFDLSFTPDGKYLAIAHSVAPFISIYKVVGGVYTKLPNPNVLPGGTGFSAQFSPDGNYLAVGNMSAPFLIIYKRNGDTFTKIDDPNILPTNAGRGSSFTKDGKYFAIAHSNAPFLSIYKVDGDSFTKLDNPSILPTDTGYSAKFSPDGNYLAVGSFSAPFLIIYKRNGDTFTKLADPDILPPRATINVQFSPNGSYLIAGHLDAPYVTIYKRSGDIFNKVTDLGQWVNKTGRGFAFSKDGVYLAVTYEIMGGLKIFKTTINTGVNKITNKNQLISGAQIGVALETKAAGEDVSVNTFPRLNQLPLE